MFRPKITKTPELIGKEDEPFCEKCQVAHVPIEPLRRMLQSSHSKLVSGAAMWFVELAKYSVQDVRQHLIDCDIDDLMLPLLGQRQKERQLAIFYFSYMACYCQRTRRIDLFDALLPLSTNIDNTVSFAYYTMLSNLCMEHEHLAARIIDSGMFDQPFQRFKKESLFPFLALSSTILNSQYKPKLPWKTAFRLLRLCCDYLALDNPVVTAYMCETIFNIAKLKNVNQQAVMSVIPLKNMFQIVYADEKMVHLGILKFISALCCFGNKHRKTLLKHGMENIFEFFKHTTEFETQKRLLNCWNNLIRGNPKPMVSVSANYIKDVFRYARQTTERTMLLSCCCFGFDVISVNRKDYNDRLVQAGAMPIIWTFAMLRANLVVICLTAIGDIIENMSKNCVKRLWKDYALISRTRQAAGFSIPYAVRLFVYENGPVSPWRIV